MSWAQADTFSLGCCMNKQNMKLEPASFARDWAKTCLNSHVHILLYLHIMKNRKTITLRASHIYPVKTWLKTFCNTMLAMWLSLLEQDLEP